MTIPQEIEAMLMDREVQYGKFARQAEIAQALKLRIKTALLARGRILLPDQLEALDMIMHKVARIVNGNPQNIDSWRDIAGYASLVVQSLEEVETAREKEQQHLRYSPFDDCIW